jgi:zinc protease
MSGSTPSTERLPGTLDRSRVPPPGPLRPSHFPAIEQSVLDNGVRVLLARTPELPVVTVSTLLEAGGVHEPEGRGGLASLTAALLESGAGGRSGPAIAEEMETLGVQLSVGASWDLAHLDLTGVRSHIPAAVEILGDLARAPTFPEAEVERLRAEQLAAILQRRAEPRGLANEMAGRFIFSDRAPFSRPLGGTTSSVGALTRADVRDFHARRFNAAGATLLFAGDLRLEEAVEMAGSRFGEWAPTPLEPVEAVVEPRFHERRIVIVDRPGSVQSEIRLGHVAVARATPDYFQLLVLNTILGGAFSSRLNMNLREKHGFTYGVSSAFLMRRVPGPFVISTAVQTEVTAAALREIVTEVEQIREAPVRPAELDDARNYIAGTFPLGLQTTAGVASRLAEIAVYDLSLDYFDDYRERILAVDAEQVLRAARERLLPERAATIIVGDAAAIRAPLEELALGPVEVVDAGEAA